MERQKPGPVGRPPGHGPTRDEEHEPNEGQPSGPEQSNNLVVNLSNRLLNAEEMEALNKGLGFVPTPRMDLFKLNCEVHDFFRKLRLKIFFEGKPTLESEDDTGLRPKSSFNPPVSSMPVEVQAFESAVLREINQLCPLDPGVFHNMSTRESMAVKTMSMDRTIIIKPADKGGATVVWDRRDYQTECLRLLDDTRNYRKLESDPTIGLKQSITMMVEHAEVNGWISPKEADFLICKNPRIPYFYILPKIHKNLTHPPGRPIVSGIGSLLEPLSRFADFFLRPIVQKTRTYLKDVLRLLKDVEFDVTLDCLLTFDVESLYTSLPQDETLEVIEQILFQEDWEYRTPRTFVLECIELALKKNFFEFEEQIFLQTHGTSMGSTFAPSIAGLYVHYLEVGKILCETNPFLSKIKLWKRYIDDILVIWRGTECEAGAFAAWLNCQIGRAHV